MLWKSLSTLKTGDMIVINLCCVQYVRRNSSASTSVINPIRSAENVFHPEIAWGFLFCLCNPHSRTGGSQDSCFIFQLEVPQLIVKILISYLHLMLIHFNVLLVFLAQGQPSRGHPP